MICLVLSSWLFHLAELVPDLFLVFWQDDVFDMTSQQHFLVWLAIVVLGWWGSLGSRVSWGRAGVKAGKVIHERVLQRLTHCPTQFFDHTPSGRIMNRMG